MTKIIWTSRIIVSYIWIVLCSDLIGFVVSEDTLCAKVMDGRFTDINFKSFTYFRWNKIFIFEGNLIYKVYIQEVTDMFMHIENHYYYWNNSELSEVYKLMKNEQLQTVFMIYSDLTMVVNLITDQKDYSMNFDVKTNKIRSRKVHVVNRTHPNYSIVHDQYKETSWGYIINKGEF